MDEKSRTVYLNLLTVETMPLRAREHVGCWSVTKVMRELQTRRFNKDLY